MVTTELVVLVAEMIEWGKKKEIIVTGVSSSYIVVSSYLHSSAIPKNNRHGWG